MQNLTGAVSVFFTGAVVVGVVAMFVKNPDGVNAAMAATSNFIKTGTKALEAKA